ncbi:MAG: arylsulfatase [Opitutaceae bacterium]|nr:arylsulfatase [Opitutaceae bacterium]
MVKRFLVLLGSKTKQRFDFDSTGVMGQLGVMATPNIIFIITDQQRFDSIGRHDCPWMKTPHLDRLAKEGMSFRRAFCPGVTCVASRAAIFTGQYPHNTGVYSFDAWAHQRTWVDDLSDGGYFCANVGKMHFMPKNARGGFHDCIIVENPGAEASWSKGGEDDWGKFLNHHGITRPAIRRKTDSEWLKKYQGLPWEYEERFHSDVFTGDAAVGFLRERRGDTPFFLEVGFPGPHEPWDPPQRFIDLYAKTDWPEAVDRGNDFDRRPPQHRAQQDLMAPQKTGELHHDAVIDMPNATREDIEHMRRHYYANVSLVDEQVGKILQALDETGQRENTWIIFTSDHGELLGDHDLAYKWLMYEPVVHIPLIIAPPPGANIAVDRETTDLVSLIDLGRTVLEMAGLPAPNRLEGISLLPWVKGEPKTPRDYVFSEDNYQVMIRSQDWKLVHYFGQESGELYDLNNDPDELTNLWDEPANRETRVELQLAILEWLGTSNYFNAPERTRQSDSTPRRWPVHSPRLHGPVAPTARPPVRP